MSTYIIGDIHGYLDVLERLLSHIKFNSTTDQLWFTGDLINGGSQSVETIRFIKSLNKSTICVLGNHDLSLLVYASQYANNTLINNINKNNNGIFDVLNAPDRQDLINWMLYRPLAYFSDQFNILLVHAGVHPAWSVATTLALAKEAELFLQHNPTKLDLLFNNLNSGDQLGYIINYLTRVRFCSVDGQLELNTKGDAANPPAGYMPWYNVPERATLGTTIVFGHWAALNGKTEQNNIIALDTGCRWGKKLSAYCLETKQFFYVENNKA